MIARVAECKLKVALDGLTDKERAQLNAAMAAPHIPHTAIVEVVEERRNLGA